MQLWLIFFSIFVSQILWFWRTPPLFSWWIQFLRFTPVSNVLFSKNKGKKQRRVLQHNRLYIQIRGMSDKIRCHRWHAGVWEIQCLRNCLWEMPRCTSCFITFPPRQFWIIAVICVCSERMFSPSVWEMREITSRTSKIFRNNFTFRVNAISVLVCTARKSLHSMNQKMARQIAPRRHIQSFIWHSVISRLVPTTNRASLHRQHAPWITADRLTRFWEKAKNCWTEHCLALQERCESLNFEKPDAWLPKQQFTHRKHQIFCAEV